MKCEQTRKHLVLHRQDATLTGTKRSEFLKHLRGCESCQIEYEGLMHTASILGGIEAPIPPPELLGKIQQKIRETHRQSQTAFFASPFSWIFDKFKIELSPQLVNCVALLCYLLTSAFVVKIAFFTEAPNHKPGLTAMEASRLVRPGQTSASHWATLKYDSIRIQEIPSTKLMDKYPLQISSPFVNIDPVKMWHTHSIEQTADSFDVSYPDTMNEKLTLFWSDIKTNL